MLLDKVHCRIVCNEIKLLRCSNHENIVKYIAQCRDLYNIFVVMELCPYDTLKRLQQERKTISEHECRYFVRQILRGVEYLHSINVIHRDLKLANVFLGENLKVKIGDFGLAIAVKNSEELERAACGTVNYFAPEMLFSTGYSVEVDVWSVGVIMFNLLVGRFPFVGKEPGDIYAKIMECKYSYRLVFDCFPAACILVIRPISAGPRIRRKRRKN